MEFAVFKKFPRQCPHPRLQNAPIPHEFRSKLYALLEPS